MFDVFQTQLQEAIVLILGTLLTAATGYAINWIRRAAKHERISAYHELLSVVVGAAESAVRSTNQVFVDQMREAAQGGNLSTGVAREAMFKSLDSLKAQLGPKLLDELKNYLGDQKKVDEVLEKQIEAAVGKVKEAVPEATSEMMSLRALRDRIAAGL